VGIDTRKLHPACFGLGLALAGLAGGLLSMVYELTPAMGEPYTISALIVITLGGLGNIPGAIAVPSCLAWRRPSVCISPVPR